MKHGPFVTQYQEYKAQLPADTILAFRLGDFYEFFFEDALLVARLLNIAVTRRQEVPMAGIPFHAVDKYLGQIVAAGHAVAVCDQVEPVVPGKLVRREIIKIFKPARPATPLLNSLETYSKTGTKAGTAARKKDYSLAWSHQEWLTKAVALEGQDNRESCCKAYYDAYRAAAYTDI